MKVLISGATGLVGLALSKSLEADGHQVLRLVRNPAQRSDADTVLWSPSERTVDVPALESQGRIDCVVHLAGEAIAAAIVAAFDRPENRDAGVIGLDGRMVERLHLEEARRTLALVALQRGG